MFKINISEKGKTYKIETESEALIGKKIGETVQGNEILLALAGYELEIKGASDKAGFPCKKDVEGTGLKRVLLKRGWGLKRKDKKKPVKGLRQKRSVRGNIISGDIVQINLIVKKSGEKKLGEIFKKETKETKLEQKPTEEKIEEKGEKTEEKKEVGEIKSETKETKSETEKKPEEKAEKKEKPKEEEKATEPKKTVEEKAEEKK